MIAAEHHITAAANARWNDQLTLEWLLDPTGYTFRIVFAATNAADATPLLTLTSAGGSPTITVETVAAGTRLTPRLTATAMDTLRAAAAAAGVVPDPPPYTGYRVWYGLKIVPPSGEADADIPLYGSFTIRDTTPA